MLLNLQNDIDVNKAREVLENHIKRGKTIDLSAISDFGNLQKILIKISDIIETYEKGAFKDLHIMHRELTCNMYYLSKEQTEANIRWNKEYYNFESKVNAAKERHADKQVPELYMCRKIMETAKGVSIAMGYEIKMN